MTSPSITSPAASANECPECSGFPMGSGCYHICPNSDSYYSPAQERADEPFYGMDADRERYADVDLDAERESEDWEPATA